MVCADYAAGFGPAAAAGALTRTQAGEPYLYRYGAAHRPNLRRPVRLLRRRPAPSSTAGCSTRRSPTATTAGWRTSASTRRSTPSPRDGIDGTRAHNPYATRYHCAACGAVARRAAGDRPLPALRLDRLGALRPGGLGRRPDDLVRLRRAALGGARRRSTWASRASASGAPTSAASSRSASNSLSPELLTRWVQFGAVSAVMRTQANGVARPGEGPPAGDRPRPDRKLAPLHEAPHAALPLPGRGPAGLSEERHAADAAPQPGRARRPARRRPRRRVHVRPRPAGGAGGRGGRRASATSSCPGDAGSTSGARRSSTSEAAASASARLGPSAGAGRRRSPRRSSELPLLRPGRRGVAAAPAGGRHPGGLRIRRPRQPRGAPRGAGADRVPARKERGRGSARTARSTRGRRGTRGSCGSTAAAREGSSSRPR